MAVRFDEKKNLFTLQTLDSTYQMKVDDHGVLLHTYYGACGRNGFFLSDRAGGQRLFRAAGR